MTAWVYRPCKIIYLDGSETWDIRSFYFNDDGTPCGWSSHPAFVFGETFEEMEKDLKKMSDDVHTQEPLVLYVYVCEECGVEDARTEHDRKKCDSCLNK